MSAHSKDVAIPTGRSATPTGPSPTVSGIAGIPIASALDAFTVPIEPGVNSILWRTAHTLMLAVHGQQGEWADHCREQARKAFAASWGREQ